MPLYMPLAGHSRLSSWMETVSPCSHSLAWCHTTDAYSLRAIIESGEFTPTPCDVFLEPLSYLFYGRPAYRSKDQTSMKMSARAPVVILFDPSLMSMQRRMFPFDTGAFHGSRYAEWLHPSMELRDFELTHLADAPRRFVPSFFDSNEDYMELKPRVPIVPYEGNFEVEAVVSLLTDRSGDHADERKLTLEMQLGRSVSFDAALVRALILPKGLKAAQFISKFLLGPGRGVEIHEYNFTPLRVAKECQPLIEEIAIQIQRSWRPS